MSFFLKAACASHRGKIRVKNEDNFYFDGKILEAESNGLKHPATMEAPVGQGLCLAVFDGMGGENFGEEASFSAAKAMQNTERSLKDYLISEREYVKRLALRLNQAVVDTAKKRKTTHMGSTVAALYFRGRYVYVCNVGDSRAYRLRAGEFLQISKDHFDPRPLRPGKKAALIQFLGIDPEELLLEPYVAKGEMKKGDLYLLCSDGLTDMLTNFEICDLMMQHTDVESTVNALIQAALERGGRDNITVIICKVA